MLKAVLRRYIRRFEVRWSYDASYFRDLLDLGSWTFIGFGLATSLGRRPEAPAAAMAAVGLVGTMTEDCVPCTQIQFDKSLRADYRLRCCKRSCRVMKPRWARMRLWAMPSPVPAWRGIPAAQPQCATGS